MQKTLLFPSENKNRINTIKLKVDNVAVNTMWPLQKKSVVLLTCYTGSILRGSEIITPFVTAMIEKIILDTR